MIALAVGGCALGCVVVVVVAIWIIYVAERKKVKSDVGGESESKVEGDKNSESEAEVWRNVCIRTVCIRTAKVLNLLT